MLPFQHARMHPMPDSSLPTARIGEDQGSRGALSGNEYGRRASEDVLSQVRLQPDGCADGRTLFLLCRSALYKTSDAVCWVVVRVCFVIMNISGDLQKCLMDEVGA